MSRASIRTPPGRPSCAATARWDGRVIGAVKTTGIYCKPSCPARRPKRENVEFFATAEEARAAGYRPCLRCKPDEVGRDREAVAKAVKLIEQAEEPPSLAELAAGGRLCAAPFPAAVQARPRRVAGRICAGASRPSAPKRALKAERPGDRRDLRRRLCGPERLLQRCQGEARHDPIGMARRRARRDHPLDAISTARSGRC